MKHLKARLCDTIRDYVMETGGRPSIIVHEPTVKRYVGKLPENISAQNDQIIFRVGSNAVKNYHYVENDLLFDATFNGKETTCLIPILSIISIFDADDQSIGISFDLAMDIRKYEDRLHQAGTDIGNILSKFQQK